MKYCFCIVFMMLFYLNGDAQSDTRERRLSYGVSFSPMFNGRTLVADGSNSWVKALRDKEEINAFSFRAGVILSCRISEHFSVQSGIIYADRRYKTRMKSLKWSEDFGRSHAFRTKQYTYFNIPMKLEYGNILNHKIGWFVGGGVNSAFLFAHNQSSHAKVGEQWKVIKDELPNMALMMLEGEIEVGMSYKMLPQLKVKGGLSFQYGITSTNRDLRLKEFLYSGGVNIGVVFTPYTRNSK